MALPYSVGSFTKLVSESEPKQGRSFVQRSCSWRGNGKTLFRFYTEYYNLPTVDHEMKIKVLDYLNAVPT